jgi:cytochrome c
MYAVIQGEHLIGPNLAHVWGQKAGTAEDFLRYSFRPGNVIALLGMKRSGLASHARHTQFLERVRDPNARRDVIAYLRAVSEGKPPARAEVKGGMMMGRSQRANLRKADAGRAGCFAYVLPRHLYGANGEEDHA